MNPGLIDNHTLPRTIEDIDINGKTVLVRVDYNVPLQPDSTIISDDTRIRASLPTIRYLISRKCKVILCSHMGRPKGRVIDDLRMSPVAERLSKLLGSPVTYVPDCVGPETLRAVGAVPQGGVILLENLRFYTEEENNNPNFANELASLADLYVNDAFGAAHRTHASTVGVTHHLTSVAGLLMTQELKMLGKTLNSPDRPFVAVIGGSKVSDKLAVLQQLTKTVDTLMVGGGMVATFLKSMGLTIGNSLVENKRLKDATRLLSTRIEKNPTLQLPKDVVVANCFSKTAVRKIVPIDCVPATWKIMDIGPMTIDMFERNLSTAKTVIWNGPMGVFEWKPFAEGTRRIAYNLASLTDATTVIGGGSTSEAVTALGLEDKMTHVSTGGGASLELLEGKTLPGVAALIDNPGIKI